MLVGRATRAQRFLMALPKTYRAVARLGWTSDTGDRDGELARPGACRSGSRSRSGEQLQTPPAYSAVKVGGRRAYELARARRDARARSRARSPSTAPSCSAHDGERARVRDRVLVGHLRALARHGPGRRLLRGARAHRRSGRSGSRTPDPERLVPLREALAFLPERALLGGRGEARCSHGRARARRRAARTEHVRLTHDGELLAIAEPRAAELQPVVVFAPA